MATRAYSSIHYLTLANGLSAVLFVAFAAVFSWGTWQSEKAAQLRQLSDAAALGAGSLDSYFRHLEIELQELGLDLEDGPGRFDPERTRSLLQRFSRRHSDLRDAAIVGMDGRILASARAHAGARLSRAAELPWFAQFRDAAVSGQGLAIGRVVPGHAPEEWTVPLAFLSRDAQGAPRYLVCADLPLARLRGYWEDLAPVHGVTLALQRDDGYLVSRYPPPAAEQLTDVYALPRRGALADWLQRQGGPSAGAVEGVGGLDPGERLFVFRRLARYPLTVDASAYTSARLAAWWNRMQYPCLLLALLLAAGALVHARAQRRLRAWEAERERREREARELNRELARRVEELEATKLELDSFSYCVAHDLRAPLRGIDGFAYQLRKVYGEQIGESGRAYLDRIRAASLQLGGTMDELLRLSETELHAFRREGVDLSALAREVVAGLEAGGRRPGLQWSIAPGVRVEGDVRLLRLLLQNLFDNALKFTSGRAAACIEFGVWPELHEGQAVYFVKDDGVGLDMKHAASLFRAFERLHPKEAFPGHGIGLALVQRIVRRHRGQLWAEGAPGQGAMFYFTLG
ncbi:MAG: ATP-binding protein [Burkholderiales bacterium]